jgi:hypothetical protein
VTDEKPTEPLAYDYFVDLHELVVDSKVVTFRSGVGSDGHYVQVTIPRGHWQALGRPGMLNVNVRSAVR